MVGNAAFLRQVKQRSSALVEKHGMTIRRPQIELPPTLYDHPKGRKTIGVINLGLGEKKTPEVVIDEGDSSKKRRHRTQIETPKQLEKCITRNPVGSFFGEQKPKR